jgi:hypothetical protein
LTIVLTGLRHRFSAVETAFMSVLRGASAVAPGDGERIASKALHANMKGT